MQIKLILIVFLYFLVKSTNGQEFPDLNFSHIGTKEGLSSDLAVQVLEDSKGFIWIATGIGLNRYDGYRFKQYFHDESNPNSLIGNEIQTMSFDSRGRLWVITTQGISCFVSDSNQFFNYGPHMPPNRLLQAGSNYSTYEDKKGTVWIIQCNKEILKVREDMNLEPDSREITGFDSAERNEKKYALTIIRDSSSEEWAFSDYHIYKMDFDHRKIIKDFDLGAELEFLPITGIFMNQDGSLLIKAYGSNLWNFNPVNQTVVQVGDFTKGKYRGPVNWKYQSKNWVLLAKDNTGLYVLDPTNFKNKIYAPDFSENRSLHGWQFRDIFVDHRGTLWVCTDQGINISSQDDRFFDIFKFNGSIFPWDEIERSSVYFGFKETTDNFLLNLRETGTLVLDKTMHVKEFIKELYPFKINYSGKACSAYDFYQKKETLYISTDSGLVALNLKKSTAISYFPNEYTAFADFRNIVPINQDRLLIRSYEHGLFEFDLRENRFVKHFGNESNCVNCLASPLNWILKSRNGRVYISANNGILIEFIPSSETFVRYRLDLVSQRSQIIRPGNLFGMAEGPDGKIWICCSSGVCVFDPIKSSSEQIYSEKGRMGETFRICFDNMGNAWVNAYSGIWCFLAKQNNWIHLNTQDGLPSGDYEGFLVKDSQGVIWEGMENAVVKFYPEKFKNKTGDIPVVITEVKSNSKKFEFNQKSRDSKKIVFEPDENSFNVDFAVLDYNNLSEIQYYYRLLPLMDSFQLNPDGHLNFNGLSPGEYHLEVKGGNKLGINYYSKDDLLIVIKHKFYQTTGYLLLLISLFLISITLIVLRRIRLIRKESALKEKIIQTETMALRAQMNPHFVFNCLNSIDSLIQNDEKEKATLYLSKFARLIRAIFENSKMETIAFNKDMEALVLYIEMEKLRLGKNFHWSIQVEDKIRYGDYKVPPMIFQPFVENAIHHGLLNKISGRKMVTIRVAFEEEWLHYLIEDNGVGRARANEYNKMNWPDHQSMGMEMTRERINYFNDGGLKNIKITDLISETGEPTGTRVEIWLNIKN